MAKPKKKQTPRRTDDEPLVGVERIDATPEQLARSLFHENRKPTKRAPRPTRR